MLPFIAAQCGALPMTGIVPLLKRQIRTVILITSSIQDGRRRNISRSCPRASNSCAFAEFLTRGLSLHLFPLKLSTAFKMDLFGIAAPSSVGTPTIIFEGPLTTAPPQTIGCVWEEDAVCSRSGFPQSPGKHVLSFLSPLLSYILSSYSYCHAQLVSLSFLERNHCLLPIVSGGPDNPYIFTSGDSSLLSYCESIFSASLNGWESTASIASGTVEPLTTISVNPPSTQPFWVDLQCKVD